MTVSLVPYGEKCIGLLVQGMVGFILMIEEKRVGFRQLTNVVISIVVAIN